MNLVASLDSSRRLLPLGFALALMALGPASRAEPPGRDAGAAPVVATDHGLVRGTTSGGVRRFLGIPYARPPVGPLRFQAPAPAAPWSQPLDATQFRPHCAQPASPFGRGSLDEDCLYLNVITPEHGRRGGHEHGHEHAVMVWIHGGALITGESDDYDATRLVMGGDVVVVTINYRLGALGFLAHAGFSAENGGASGNWGFLDQQAALAWVQRNIRHFGGDPERVTIFGESAGGASVHAQLVSPGARGLFARAIVESGGFDGRQPTLAEAEAQGSALAAAAGCADPGAEAAAACLRALPVAAILANQSGRSGSIVDGRVLPEAIGSAITAGRFHRVPVLEGSNHDEFRLFVASNLELGSGPVTPAAYPAAVAATLSLPPAAVAPVLAEYPLANYPSPGLALGALGTDAAFACSARRAQEALSRFVPTFAYEFNDVDAPELFLPPVSFPYGATHASEIQYLFDLPRVVPAPPLTPAQQTLAADMIQYWTTFARTGQPNSHTAPFWPRFFAAADDVQSLVPPAARLEHGFRADHRCAFWDAAASH